MTSPHRSRAASAALLVLAAALASGCSQGGKVWIGEGYLERNRVYRSETFVREPYVLDLAHDTLVLRCRTTREEAPRLRVAPFKVGMTQRWESRPVAIGSSERAHQRAAGRSFGAVFEHTVTLAGLEPRQRYHCLLDNGTKEVRDALVRTLPAPADEDAELSFLVLGDSGTGSDAQLAVARAIARSLERGRGLAHGIDFVLHTGDLVYERGEAEDYDPVVFAPYREVLRRVPLFAALGNHDAWSGARAFYDAFPRGSPERPWWSRRIGPLELVVCDSTYRRSWPFGLKPSFDDLRWTTSRQQGWLRAVLATRRTPWRFLLLHHPVLSAGTRHGSGRFFAEWAMRELREALRSAFGRVDFIVAGHEHHYERSLPIDPAWIAKNGDLELPEDAARPKGPGGVPIDGRTVSVIQGAGGGLRVDGPGARLGWAFAWTVFLPIGSPLWMSKGPIGLDAVDEDEPWVAEAAMVYGVSRFDVSRATVRLRTWSVDPSSSRVELIDDVTYTRTPSP